MFSESPRDDLFDMYVYIGRDIRTLMVEGTVFDQLLAVRTLSLSAAVTRSMKRLNRSSNLVCIMCIYLVYVYELVCRSNCSSQNTTKQ
jgi:hypothetical protein